MKVNIQCFKSLFIVLGLIITLSGCEFLLPSTSKAITEKQQLEELQKQNSILIDIANSLKRIANLIEKE